MIIASDYDTIVDVGCADGYYAVGLARRMPRTTVRAHDINPGAQTLCAELASLNGVADRVQVSGIFEGADFAALPPGRTLIFMDAEGVEADLMQPKLYPALSDVAVLVECHDVFRPGLSRQIADRFAATHAITRIEPQLHCPTLPAWFAELGHLDQLLAIWEWRMGPTPWLYMLPQAQ